MAVRGKAVGRILYRVDTGLGFSIAKLVSWRVSSIQRPPRREGAYVKVPPLGRNMAGKRVYLREIGGSGRASFGLDWWPDDFSATEKAAWATSVKEIGLEIENHLRRMDECKAEGHDCATCESNCLARLRLMRVSLTKAMKMSRP